MREVIKKSAVPLYAVAACWLLWALLLPMYKLLHFIILIVLSIAVYIVFSKLFPGTKIQVECEPEKTGNELVDSLISDRAKYTREFKRLNDAIGDDYVSRQIDALENSFSKIIDYIIAHPEKARQIRQFMNYYLPTTLKLLNTYSTLSEQNISGDNINRTMDDIKNILSTIVTAFNKQLDSLFADVALDISTDITVLNNMIKAGGLSDNADFETKEKGL